jgi:dTDP-4-amino-4,6-dideoxygalactose transaminase
MTRPLPLAQPDFDEQEVDAVRRVLCSGRVVQGPEVEAFEQAVADLHHAAHCVAVSSGTAALHVCLLALQLGPGDAIFVPSFAWPSAVNAAMRVGARPVLVDVLPGTYNIDPDDLRRRIDGCRAQGLGRPRLIVPVHEFGLAADMDAVCRIAAEHGVEIVEDAACALGASHRGTMVGTFGKAGIFSFHPRKSITTGEGGAIVSNDDAFARTCRILRNHGQHPTGGKRDFVLPGLNYRMTEIQAAIGRVQLGRFPETLRRRRMLAAAYLQAAGGIPDVAFPAADDEHTWQTFMVNLPDHADRDRIVDRLAAEQIGAGPGAVAAHCYKFYRDALGDRDCELPVSARLHRLGLALPFYPAMDRQDVQRCVAALRRVLRSPPEHCRS